LTRDVTELTNAELERIILDADPSLRERHSGRRATAVEDRYAHQRSTPCFTSAELEEIILNQQRQAGNRPALPRPRS
jgi:hypothetical protein